MGVAPKEDDNNNNDKKTNYPIQIRQMIWTYTAPKNIQMASLYMKR